MGRHDMRTTAKNVTPVAGAALLGVVLGLILAIHPAFAGTGVANARGGVRGVGYISVHGSTVSFDAGPGTVCTSLNGACDAGAGSFELVANSCHADGGNCAASGGGGFTANDAGERLQIFTATGPDGGGPMWVDPPLTNDLRVNLQGYWGFNALTYFDSTPGGGALTCAPAVCSWDAGVYRSGVVLPTSTALNLPATFAEYTGTFAFSFWTKITGCADWEPTVSSSTDVALYIMADCHLSMFYGGGTFEFTDVHVTPGAWHLVVYAAEPDGLSYVWVDGVESTGHGDNRGFSWTRWGVSASHAMNGAVVDELAFWNRYLTKGEALALWQRGRGLYYPLDNAELPYPLTLLGDPGAAGQVLASNGGGDAGPSWVDVEADSVGQLCGSVPPGHSYGFFFPIIHANFPEVRHALSLTADITWTGDASVPDGGVMEVLVQGADGGSPCGLGQFAYDWQQGPLTWDCGDAGIGPGQVILQLGVGGAGGIYPPGFNACLEYHR